MPGPGEAIQYHTRHLYLHQEILENRSALLHSYSKVMTLALHIDKA